MEKCAIGKKKLPLHCTARVWWRQLFYSPNPSKWDYCQVMPQVRPPWTFSVILSCLISQICTCPLSPALTLTKSHWINTLSFYMAALAALFSVLNIVPRTKGMRHMTGNSLGYVNICLSCSEPANPSQEPPGTLLFDVSILFGEVLRSKSSLTVFHNMN